MLRARERGVQAPQHARDVLAEHLAGVARGDVLAGPALVDLASEGLPELEADPGRALSGGERPQQLAQPLPVAAQTRDAIVVHGPARHLVGDEGIAVTVAADPRPELEK